MTDRYVKIDEDEFKKLREFMEKEEAEGNLDTSSAKLREKIKSMKPYEDDEKSGS